MLDWRAVAAVAAGGALGSVARFAIQTLVGARLGTGFPWATFAINVSGSFLIGLVVELAVRGGGGITPLLRIFLAVGVLGGFTTFSSFSLESLALAKSGAPTLALLYASGSVVCGLVAAYCGSIAGRGGVAL